MRYNEIEKENRHLLERMTDIIVNPKPLYNEGTGGSKKIIHKPTLNAGARKKELERITKENYRFLQRLQAKKSNFDVMKWEKERRS